MSRMENAGQGGGQTGSLGESAGNVKQNIREMGGQIRDAASEKYGELRDQAQHGCVTETPSTMRVTGSLSVQLSVSCWQVLSAASPAHWLSSRVVVTTFSPVTVYGVAPSIGAVQLISLIVNDVQPNEGSQMLTGMV